ncbi:MAG: hypothetical protein ABIV51_07810 [Saprospiraceae bacterium]
MKSTIVTNGSDWANSNSQHIKDLNDRFIQTTFPSCSGCDALKGITKVDEVKLHIVVEDLSAINQATWITAIKSKILDPADRGNIKIIFSQIE